MAALASMPRPAFPVLREAAAVQPFLAKAPGSVAAGYPALRGDKLPAVSLAWIVKIYFTPGFRPVTV
ncbi:hypothetical protein D3C75_1148550 [compost metagenome]